MTTPCHAPMHGQDSGGKTTKRIKLGKKKVFKRLRKKGETRDEEKNNNKKRKRKKKENLSSLLDKLSSNC
jgi:hypothetical protein